MSQQRLFIAIQLEQRLCQGVKQSVGRLKKRQPSIRWTKQHNLHLTLAFLGELAEKQLAGLLVVMQQVAMTSRPFYLQLGSLGFFPNWQHPQIIWVEVKTEQAELNMLANRLRQHLERAHYPIDRKPFIPHITLGRIKAEGGPQLAFDLDQSWSLPAGSQQVDRMSLIQSQLTSQGPIYTAIEQVPFGL